MKNTAITWSPEKLLAIDYTPEQQIAIAEALAEIESDKSGFCDYLRSERIVRRGEQTFAVFGHIARELLSFSDAEDERGRYEYLPAIVDGQMIEQAPDEGSSGMLYLMRCTHRRGKPYPGKWTCAYLGRGWLRADELNLSNGEIADRIVDEIERGENVVTSKPAGWV
jgi:hypothetical protein